jgi:hypothetical protein
MYGIDNIFYFLQLYENRQKLVFGSLSPYVFFQNRRRRHCHLHRRRTSKTGTVRTAHQRSRSTIT